MKSLKFIWISTLVLKLILAALIPLTTDEAYYWVWSWRPQLSYYDHPPFVAWLFGFGHLFESLGHGVRWPGVLLGHCTLLIWILIWNLISKPSERDQQVRWWMILTLCSPLLGFGSLIITPDVPVLFFWALSIYFVIRIFQNQKTIEYAFLGTALGLGFCAKYHIVLFVPILLTYLTFERKWSEVSWKKVSLTLLFGLIFSSPVLVWNYQNEFASFLFQIKHGLSRPEYNFYWTWTYVLAQVMVLFPTVVWTACKAKLQGISRLFYYFGWGPLVFFFLSSFKALVEVNWPIIAYPAFFVLAVLGTKRFLLFKIANVFWVVLFCILGSHLAKPWIPSAPEKLSEFSQFEPILTKREKYQPLYASTYQMASWVWYETKTPFFKLNGMSRFDLFDTYPEGKPNEFPVFVAMKRHTGMPDWVENDPQFKVIEVESFENDFVIVRIDR